MTDLPMSLISIPKYVEGNSYLEFKRDLAIWQLLKIAKPEEEGPLIYRSLTGKAKFSCNDLTVEQVGSKDGLKLILQRLDKLFLGEANQRIYYALDEFEKFRRTPSMTMTDFIFNFENLHNEVNKYKCSYPDGVLAYRLLKAANLSNEHERLCRATVATGEWSYESVVNQLKKIFAETPSNNCKDLPVKLETAYHTTSSSPCYFENDQYRNIENPEYEIENNTNETSYEQYVPEDEYDIYYTPSNSSRVYANKPRVPFKPQNNTYPPQRRPPYQQNQYQPNQYQPIQYQPNQYQRNNRFPVNYRSYESRPPTSNEFKTLKASYNPDPGTLNPKDSKGNFTICRRCRSIYHWISDCPHNNTVNANRENSSNCFYSRNEEDIYIALLQSCIPNSSDQITGLVAETLCHGVIDSGCSKTVAGKHWLEDYLATMPEEELSKIEYLDSEATFRFGDSKPVKSEGKAMLPVIIGGREVKLETEIVNSDVPLLLSKNTMKSAKAKQDYENDCIYLFGNKQNMICTESGHYAIPICRAKISKEDQLNEINTVLFNSQNSIVQSNDSIARKLHHQFAHPSAKRLIDYLKTAGSDDKELFNAIETVSERCNTCKRYKRANPRPIVMFPLASEFNETVALDLKTYENNTTYFIHVIDHATRFSTASVIKSKRSEVIVNEFFKIWVGIFGCPQKVLSDNGREFANQEFIQMCESLNINYITTAAESPWSNGLVERHNAVIGEAVNKILEETNCSLDVALCWAVNAKNSLQNIYGFSPHQLVFGKNPNLPSVLNNKLPALEGISGSKLVADHLNALHQARREMIRLEASEKIRRAIKAKTRTHTNIHYLPGEEVYYKREGDGRWKGPGRVIGQDGQKVLVKTPSSLISVHSCRICLTGDAEALRNDINEEKSNSKDNEESQDPINNLDSALQNSETSDSESISHSGVLPFNRNESSSNCAIPQLPSQSNDNIKDQTNSIHIHNETNLPNLIDPDTLETEETTEDKNNSSETKKLPMKNQCVKYRSHENDEWNFVKIGTRAGKSGGKYENWLNVENLKNGKEYSIDWADVSEWIPVHHETFHATYKKDNFEEARQKELMKWKSLNVYEEIEDTGQPTVSVKWVYKEKVVNNETSKKARLVARGYEELNSDIFTDSPTCNKDSLRVVISLISSKNWTLNSFDITAAFLQGKSLDRDIFLRPPKEAHANGKVWKLLKCVYGLNEASRYWYLRIRGELVKLGCKCSKADPTVYYFHTDSLEGLMISHVDDFIWAGTENFQLTVIVKIKTIFSISAESSTAFKYLGLDLLQDERGIFISLSKYTNELEEIDIDAERRKEKDQIITEKEITVLRSAIGKLNWLAVQSRPDISYSVSILASKLKEATVKELMYANKVIRYCKMTDKCLYFPKLDLENLQIKCYADASFGKLPDGGSQGGMFLELCDKNRSCPIYWQSKRIHRVVNNIMAAETLAMKDTLDAGFLVKSLLEELLQNGESEIPVEAITDSKSLYEAAHSTKSVTDRRLRIDLSILREYIMNDKFTISWVSSHEQLADVLTKDGVDGSKIRDHISI